MIAKPPITILLLATALWWACALPAAGGGAACVPADLAVAIDVGHTLKSPGATSARGVPEYRFNRALAQAVLDALKQGGFSASFLINADGTIASLRERTAAAVRGHAGLFLAIHHDSVQPRYLTRWTFEGVERPYSDRFRGYSLFVSGIQPAYAASRRLGEDLGRALKAQGLTPTLHHAEPIPGEGRTLLVADLGLYRFDDLIVLKTATMPAVLLEAGVILHRDEETALADPAYRRRIAVAVVAAVRDYCAGSGGQRVP